MRRRPFKIQCLIKSFKFISTISKPLSLLIQISAAMIFPQNIRWIYFLPSKICLSYIHAKSIPGLLNQRSANIYLISKSFVLLKEKGISWLSKSISDVYSSSYFANQLIIIYLLLHTYIMFTSAAASLKAVRIEIRPDSQIDFILYGYAIVPNNRQSAFFITF